MDTKTETGHTTTSRLIKTTTGALVAEYVATCIHHVDEGLGLVFGVKLNSLLTPITFGIPLFITLGLLYLYKKTSSRFFLVVFSLTTIVWWGGGIGLWDGLYNHTLNLLLYSAQVPPKMMRMIYPKYVLPPNTGILTIPCDKARFCPLTPNLVLYIGTAMLSLVVACFLTFTVYRLIRARWNDRQISEQKLPRTVMVGTSLGLVAAFGVMPLLGSFMSTGNLPSLFFALPLMGVSVLALVVAIVGLKRR